MWEQVSKNLSAFFSMPLVRNILTVTYIIVGILLIMSRTSVGRKALLGFKDQYEKIKAEHKSIVEQKDRVIAEMKAEFNDRERELKQDYENKMAVLTFKANHAINSMCGLLQEFPNVMIQEKAAEIKKDFDTSTLGISDLVDFEVMKANAAANLAITELEQRIKALEDSLKVSDNNDGKEE